MQNQKNFQCVLDQNDLNVLQELLNNFPLGSVNVRQAANANTHAQNILDFIGRKTSEVLPEIKPEQGKEKKG